VNFFVIEDFNHLRANGLGVIDDSLIQEVDDSEP
jgi:hypothetical protein